jgi:YD repeat-containing protein
LNNGSDPNAFSNAFKTLYAYDVLGNLLCVEQRGNVSGTGCSSDPSQDATSGWRVRRFTYDSLTQVLTAKNPESGTVTYSYNDDAVLISKTDARNITTYFSRSDDSPTDALDALHRVHKKTYSNNDPSVSYSYDQTSYNGLTIADGVGRRTGMSDSSGQTAWSYDAMGRTTDEKRTIGTAPPKTISYQYDLAGALKQLTYPDGEVVAFANNAAGRPLSAIDSTLNINFAKNAGYAPTGALSSLQIGSTATSSGVLACNQYNKRLQPANIGAFLLTSCPSDFTTPTAAQTVMNLNYDFGLGTADNGNVLSITNRKDANRSAVFGYDQLNRLSSAQTNSNRWGNSYDYDAWGNLLHKNQVSGKTSGENFQQTFDVKNRISGAPPTCNPSVVYCYDTAGNLLNAGFGSTFAYDAESRITSAGGVTYTYDGDGNRVKKSNGTLYWGAGPLAESDLNGNMLRNFVFFGSKRIARKDSFWQRRSLLLCRSPRYCRCRNQRHRHDGKRI